LHCEIRPDYDEELLLIVTYDVCEIGIGEGLVRRYPDESKRPIAFISQTLSKSEQKWSSINWKEALALIFPITHFINIRRRFKLVSDHKPLEYIFDPSKKLP